MHSFSVALVHTSSPRHSARSKIIHIGDGWFGHITPSRMHWNYKPINECQHLTPFLFFFIFVVCYNQTRFTATFSILQRFLSVLCSFSILISTSICIRCTVAECDVYTSIRTQYTHNDVQSILLCVSCETKNRSPVLLSQTNIQERKKRWIFRTFVLSFGSVPVPMLFAVRLPWLYHNISHSHRMEIRSTSPCLPFCFPINVFVSFGPQCTFSPGFICSSSAVCYYNNKQQQLENNVFA